MRFTVRKVAPDEDHGRARRGRQQDEPGDVRVDLPGREVGAKQPADKEPSEQRH